MQGTLVPGQTITVNRFNVQVERYLSQGKSFINLNINPEISAGGFAHVYLVRTATPVYNTTHHVLKRIAVANEAMLSEVKKEVDVMRLLKGHPNIVHLIDAAWHRMSNGLYEVFILMEFCPGGGIIDMMNRRLRERLTEAEILQIFVDVCEGVAYMHNLRPPLLHRDLKVENILQASPTSFKLCDFGSACTVAPKPPSTTQEIRALEADLNRHTTLQYRAPEMVDVYLRRPVDEKSDVWALGVLLYKLCYYTTPFEEHGPLAILNVQYRTPPYPVYSAQMNALIGSMLREHGTHRPSVFEILNQVHQLRGTKSQFHYNIPTPAPLSPRQSKPVMTVERVRQSTSTSNSKSAVTTAISPTKNAGVQAREKVLEAIEPMRRGRPTPSSKATGSTSRSSSPQKELKQSQGNKDWLSSGFDAESDKVWKAATVPDLGRSNVDNAWSLGQDKPKIDKSDLKKEAFGDDFGGKLWDSFAPASRSNAELLPAQTPLPATLSKSTITPTRTAAITGLNEKPGSTLRPKDAFEGLGLTRSSEKQAPTLGEARKLRTGLAIMSSHAHESNKASLPAKSVSTPSYQSQSLSPAPPLHPTASGSSWSSQPPASRPQSSLQGDGLSAEARYPSLEELDARFESPSKSQSSPSTGKPSPSKTEVSSPFRQSDIIKSPTIQVKANVAPNLPSPPDNSLQRPSLVRKHRSSVTIKHNPPLGMEDFKSSVFAGSSSTYTTEDTPKLPTRPTANKDWLTGDDDDAPSSHPVKTQSDAPKLRESPSKRASYVVQTSVQPRSVLHGEVSLASTDSSSPSIEKFTRTFPALDPADHRNSSLKSTRQEKEPESASSADEEPEDASGYNRNSSKTRTPDTQRPRRKGRQSSVHDLVDLWGGGVGSPTKEKEQAVRSTITPASYKPAGGNNISQKRRSAALPTISTMKQPNPSTHQSMLSPPDSGKSSVTSAGSKQTPSTVSPPTSARSRPQSMFIFPSKSTEASPVTSPGLLPPEEPKARTNVRRSSISGMVQRYEAIGGSTKSGPAPPVLPKPSTLTAANGRLRTSPTPSGSDSKSGQINGRNISSLTLPDDISSVSSSRTSPGLSRGSPLLEATRDDAKEGTARPRRTSLKPESSIFPAKKSASEEASTRLPEPRSPSPERPYQGVGKLIDQWQRKVEADSARNPAVPKRGGFVAKRAGLVNGGSTTRGQ